MLGSWSLEALKVGRDAEVDLLCTVTVLGNVTNCAVVREAPENLGFGASAIRISKLFEMKPATKDGKAIESRVRIPLKFNNPTPPMIVEPDWLKRPNSEQLGDAYPPRAMEIGKSGKVVMECEVTVTGNVHHCAVVAEDPKGLDFGNAALSLANLFQMRPALRDGEAIESRVRVPISFSCAGCQAIGPVQTRMHFRSPPWLAAPTFEQWKAAYPAKARAAGAGGAVNFECGFKGDGAIGACAVQAENPRNLGFAAAARSLLPHFKSISLDGDNKSTRGASVSLTIAWPKDVVAGDVARGAPEQFRGPTEEVIRAAFPKAAAAEGVTAGTAILQCGLVEGGGLQQCRVVQETPAAKGFGAAALTLAGDIKLSLWGTDGQPVPRTVAFRVPLKKSN